MNSTKKTLKNNGTAKKQPQKLQQGTQSNKGTIFAVVLAAVVVLVSGIIAWENLHPRLIFTPNGEKTYLEDMTYHIMQTEGMYNSIDALYQQLGYQQSYWTMEEDGVSTQDRARKDTVDNAVEMEILYAEAVKNGYEATAEEKEKAAADAKDMLSNMSEEQKEKTGFTEENLTEILTKETVAFRYRQMLLIPLISMMMKSRLV